MKEKEIEKKRLPILTNILTSSEVHNLLCVSMNCNGTCHGTRSSVLTTSRLMWTFSTEIVKHSYSLLVISANSILKNTTLEAHTVWKVLHFNVWKDLKFVYFTYWIFKNSQDGYISKCNFLHYSSLHHHRWGHFSCPTSHTSSIFYRSNSAVFSPWCARNPRIFRHFNGNVC